MLFLELALIRWLGESVLYLSFFSNFVLLASFLGIGLGFLARARKNLAVHLPVVLLGLIAFVMGVPVEIDRSARDVLFIGEGAPSGLPIWLILPILFVAVAFIMAAVGQQVALAFARLEALRAYRIDILGSIAGIASFVGLAALGARPAVWGALVAVTIWLMVRKHLRQTGWAYLAASVVLLGVQSLMPGWQWSPYYRVEVTEESDFAYINVNGIPHQATASIESLADLDWLTSWPYRVLGPSVELGNVLIIGAGNGNDVAFALDAGASHIDAVEIDPVIRRVGGDLNPEKPYRDVRVSVHIDDGRAFMEGATDSYDLILFALPDSLTSIAGQSNLRLESYLFTVEAFETAERLLSETGVFALYNTHSEQWVVDRMAKTMNVVLASPICQVGSTSRSRVMLASGPGIDPLCPTGRLIEAFPGPEPVTDDRPFVYVRDRVIPSFYLVAVAGILLISVLGVRLLEGGTGAIKRYPDLFVMGVAFLLLETKGVSQFALWFGTTWHVNALVFAGVLLTVLLAIEVSRSTTIPIGLLYGALAMSVVAVWLVPPAAVLSLGYVQRWLVGSILTFMPIFLANLVFSRRFKETASSTDAFGVNLLGAMVGGVLEYLTLIIGHRSLSLLAGFLYLLAFILWQRNRGVGSLALT